MFPFFYQFFKNITGVFRGRKNWLWLGLIFLLTFVIVESGLDWFWFSHLQSSFWRLWFFPVVIIGGQLPILLPLILWIIGRIKKSFVLLNTAWASAQAALLGLLLSSFFKVFTGRLHPPLDYVIGVSLDVSRGFRFGFWRGGVFWGWPSSHATVSFALATTLVTLFPQKKWIRVLALGYALYVAVGVSMSIHWLSEAVAGVILGSLIGKTVGKTFARRVK